MERGGWKKPKKTPGDFSRRRAGLWRLSHGARSIFETRWISRRGGAIVWHTPAFVMCVCVTPANVMCVCACDSRICHVCVCESCIYQTAKEPYSLLRELSGLLKEPNFVSKEPYNMPKEPYDLTKEPFF